MTWNTRTNTETRLERHSLLRACGLGLVLAFGCGEAEAPAIPSDSGESNVAPGAIESPSEEPVKDATGASPAMDVAASNGEAGDKEGTEEGTDDDAELLAPQPAEQLPAEQLPADEPPDALEEITRELTERSGSLSVVEITEGLRQSVAYADQTLYLPEQASGSLPAVAIVPGFNTPQSSIQAWGPFLASHGIVALTFGTNSPLDSAELRADALVDALETLRVESERVGGPAEGLIDVDRLGVMGWSLGGGGVLLTAARTPSLKAAITMAVFSPGPADPALSVPTLFLAGSADPNAGGHSQRVFESMPEGTTALLYEVEGGPHEIGNDPANAEGQIGSLGLSWLKVYLQGDERFSPFLSQEPSGASDFRNR